MPKPTAAAPKSSPPEIPKLNLGPASTLGSQKPQAPVRKGEIDPKLRLPSPPRKVQVKDDELLGKPSKATVYRQDPPWNPSSSWADVAARAPPADTRAAGQKRSFSKNPKEVKDPLPREG